MRIDDYKNACRLSAAELAKKDPLATAAASGTNWDGSSFILPFFGRQVKVTASVYKTSPEAAYAVRNIYKKLCQ
ncbi:hypothetical protein LJB99_05085 [Deltaproteobacteria bacterium OttesenSCG-928-K17]|nr:hypothetical protein [Deltaproteobacteria bacterium OttesenSCG-928-K17]